MPLAKKKVAKKKVAKKKVAKKKVAKKKVAKKTANYPFPFLGEGQAGYFEWGDIYLFFSRPPQGLKKRIKDSVPQPYTDRITWSGNILYCSSGQFINANIATSYEADDGEPKPHSFFGMEPTDGQVEAFEAHVERWLEEVHALCPLLFVVRPEDWEAGGTKLGPWHQWSARQIRDQVLPPLEGFFAEKPRTSTGSYLLDYVLSFVSSRVRKKLIGPYPRWR